MKFKTLADSEFCDEVQLISSQKGPLLRCTTIPRYKSSGLSGDEWRISAMWQIGKNEWKDFDGGYRNIKTACQALYGGLYSSHPDMQSIMIATVDWYQKGSKIYESSYDSQPLSLIHTAGHLPWAYMMAQESYVYRNQNELCFQPGCDNRAVATYKLRFEYCDHGHKTENKFNYHRRFCARHLRRGDCGLEDADRNYIVIDGPGPDQAQGFDDDISPAKFGGFIL